MKQKNKIKKIICSVLSFLLVLTCISTFELKVNALTSRKKLPYYIDFDSSIYFDVDIIDFHQMLVDCGFPNSTDDDYLCWLGDFHNYNANNGKVYFDVYYIKLNATSGYNRFNFNGLYQYNTSDWLQNRKLSPNEFDWQTNYVCFGKGGTYGRPTRYTFQWDTINKTVVRSTSNPNGYLQSDYIFLNGKNASQKNEYGFTTGIPIWFYNSGNNVTSGTYRIDYNGGYDIYDSFDIYCFGIPVGVPISPDLSGDNITSPDAQPPTSPTPNTYTPSTYNPPSFDNSDTQSALESIFDIITYNGSYLLNNIIGAIDNLDGNIKAYIEYLKDSIDYGSQKIINNIKNGIQNMYDNIENFFAPKLEDITDALNSLKEFGQDVKDFVDLFIHPFDSTQAQNDINNSAFVSQISTTKTQIQSFANIFSSIQEPNNLIYTFDMTGLFVSFGVWEVDLSILSGILPYIRGILACILLYSLIVTIFTSINSYIGGNSSKNDNND